MTKLTSQSGSALLAAMLIVAALVGLMTLFGRFVVVELRTNTSLEDASIAFSSAEAGLEDGLLRVRFNRSSEIPHQDMTPTSPETARVNLQTSLGTQSGSLNTLPGNPTQPTYDLRVWYKVPQIGSFASTDLNSLKYPFQIFKDQTLELDVSNLQGQNLTFAYRSPSGNQARIDIRVIQQGCNGIPDNVCEFRVPLSDPATGRDAITIPIPIGTTNQQFRLQIRPYIFLPGSQTPAPDASSINYALKPEQSTSLIDGGTTFVEATGYFGSAKRKLVARVDRKNGTVLGVFDYSLFTRDSLGF